MSAAARFLAAWLTPILWLEMSALIVDHGPDGLGIALALMLAPLIAVGILPRALPANTQESRFRAAIFLVAVALLVCAHLGLAGDLASGLGVPRWMGIAMAAVGGWVVSEFRPSRRLVPLLLLAAIVAVSVPLAARARAAGVGPLTAWSRVASQTAFRFPAGSPWVTEGADLSATGRRSIAFDEEHRLTAPAGGRLRAHVQDGRRTADLEWALTPGQSVTLRPGDRLYADGGVRVRFEADKRVPGSPPSGIAWAAGVAPDWPRQAGLLVTVLFGALAILQAGPGKRFDRLAMGVIGGGALVALLWAQVSAIYALLDAPDVFLGGVTPARVLLRLVPNGASADRAVTPLQIVALAGAGASFLASAVALRERLGAWRAIGGGETALWAELFAVSALASLGPVGPWPLALWALGGAASALGSATIWSNDTGAATAAGIVGLVVFASLSVIAALRPAGHGFSGALLAYPALAAVPASAIALWIGRRPSGGRVRRSAKASDSS